MVKDFRSNGLFKELSAEQLDMLESHLHLREYSDGDMIMEEGDDGDFLCLIESGEVEVLRNQMAIATMGPDEHFGLMSYLDGSKRAASVRSKGETRVRVMAFKTLSDLSTSKEHGAVFKQILANHIDQQHQLLRSMNDTVVSEMQAKLKEAELRVNFGKLFMMVVFGLTGYIFILDFMSWLEMQSGIVFSTLLIIALGSIGYRFIKHSTLPDETFGLTLKNWKPAVIDALVWTFASSRSTCFSPSAGCRPVSSLSPTYSLSRRRRSLYVAPFKAAFSISFKASMRHGKPLC